MNRSTLKRQSFDILMGTVALACLTAFFLGSALSDRLSGVNQPIARIKSGSARKKANGEARFVEAKVGTEFYNADAIWVASHDPVELVTDSGEELKISNGSLMIFKRPFKGTSLMKTPFILIRELTLGSSGKVNSENVQLLQGQADYGSVSIPVAQDTTQAGGGSAITTPASLEQALGSSSPGEKPSPREGKELFPPEGGIIYSREENQVSVTFSWGQPIDGSIIVTQENSNKMESKKVSGERFTEIKLEQAHSYIWQSVTPDGRVTAGPFHFELRKLDDATAAKLVREHSPGKEPKNVIVYW